MACRHRDLGVLCQELSDSLETLRLCHSHSRAISKIVNLQLNAKLKLCVCASVTYEARHLKIYLNYFFPELQKINILSNIL